MPVGQGGTKNNLNLNFGTETFSRAKKKEKTVQEHLVLLFASDEPWRTEVNASQRHPSQWHSNNEDLRRQVRL